MEKYHGSSRYIGAWHYALLNLLYCIPLIGWIILIVHMIDKKNENRCHFARSYLTRPVFMLLIAAIAVGVTYLVIGADEFKRICDLFVKAWNDLSGSI